MFLKRKKEWLIRTCENVILGPVSRKKVIELIEKGSLRLDDEICKGNGYWLFVRETELVNKFLYENQTQPFNPVCRIETYFANQENS